MSDRPPLLACESTGQGPRLVLIHGFTQTRNCWGPFDELLGDRRELVRVDAPNHGESRELALDLVAGADALGATGGHADYLGYSMGGRFALQLGLRRPALVRRLILIGATAGLTTERARAARRAADDARASGIEADGVPAFLDDWLTLPLFGGLTPETSHRDARLDNSAAGLAASLRLAGTGAMENLWPRLAELMMPVLAIAGEYDLKFSTLAAQMVEAIGDNATLAIVAGAGHTAHLEQPGTTADLVSSWLDQTA